MNASSENTPQGNSEWLKTFNLNLEDKVTCDTEGCDGVGGWWTKVSCCDKVFIFCNECVKKNHLFIAWLAASNKVVVCKHCHTERSPIGWQTRPEQL